MIDLHSHTDQSDGTLSPAALLAEARRVGVRTLAITDHDTFAGYDQAKLLAIDAGVELICGIELSTTFQGRPVHLLGYFLDENANPDHQAGFRDWLSGVQASRTERNIRQAKRLKELGVDVSLEEAQKVGRGMTGRPHFARVMMEKGYVDSIEQAFNLYLGESAKAYVTREEQPFSKAVAQIRRAGGIASVAHPIRFPGDFAAALPQLVDDGLNALEAYHSDHDPAHTQRFLDLAKQYGMLVTGGSDFHGTVKPAISLGTGQNINLQIPEDLVLRLRGGMR